MSYRHALFTVFISSFCIMVIELVAGRFVAPSLGVSLYTWTTVIGVCLSGIGVGNYVGGRTADRWPQPQTMAIFLLLSALSSISIVFFAQAADSVTLPNSVPIVLRYAAYIGFIFFLPTMLLGMITPLAIKLSLKDLSRAGVTVGTVYAVSLAGSVIGTFATGFYLISLFGTRTIVALVAGVLAVLALSVGVRAARSRSVLLLAALIALGYVAYARGALVSPCTRETNYYCIRVIYTMLLDEGEEPVKALRLDRLDHAYRSDKNPLKLIYDYEKAYAVIATNLVKERPKLQVLFLGGGGYVFPIYMERLYRETELTVVEIDPGVTEIARQEFGLMPDSRIAVFDQDARQYLYHLSPSRKFDLIVGDAFNDLSIPYHLTTREFLRLVQAHLSPRGVYMANTIDAPSFGYFVRAHVRTMQSVFAHVYLVATGPRWQDISRTTFVIIASDSRPDRVALLATADDLAYAPIFYVVPEEELENYLARERAVIITDDYAPVDNLVAPIFAERQ